MTIIVESTRAEKWLYTQLANDGTIAGIVGTRIFAEVTPQEVTDLPVLIYQFVPGLPTIYGNGATIVWQKLMYRVKAITRAKTATSLQTLIDRVCTVLHAQHGGVTGADIDYCVRRDPFRMVTVENGQMYQHLGYTFELAVRSADV